MTKEVKILAAIIGAVFIGVGVLLFMQDNKAVVDSQPIDGSKLIRSDSQIIGNVDAPNTLVEFGDYQCPACAAGAPIIDQLLKDNPDKLRVVFRHFPLPQHANAPEGSQAAIAAGKQGKYHEMHSLLYEKQKEWETLSNPADKFAEYAQSLGLNVDTFKSDYSDSGLTARIQLDKDDGNSLEVNSTPTLYLNGEKLAGWNFANLAEVIKSKLK